METEGIGPDDDAVNVTRLVMDRWPGHSVAWYRAALNRIAWLIEHGNMDGCPVRLPYEQKF